MFLPFRTWIFVIAVIAGLATSYSVFAQETVFDRLDGTGPSGKKVDVIEWDGNLEVHAYPHGSLKGLSAKLDDRTEGKKVMVIGYRFAAGARPLVRRAILGVPFTKDIKAFIDPTEKEFDKLALSNQALGKPFVPYKLDPAPKQWYPDGVEDQAAPKENPVLTDTAPATPENRAPASVPKGKVLPPQQKQDSAPRESIDTDEGSVGHFSW